MLPFRLISTRRLRALERAAGALAVREAHDAGAAEGRLDGAVLACVGVTARLLAAQGWTREEREAALERIRASVRASGGIQ
jgi:hypothetical protein